jgi:acetylornithine deacetylase/succinyl-diaminopimelate desuccinylase-like protein
MGSGVTGVVYFAMVPDRRLSLDFSMNRVALKKFIDGVWTREIVPEITEYIRIPAKSPDFDPKWQANGHIDRAVEHMMRWASEKVRDLPGATIEVVRLKGRTPVIFIEAPGTIDDTVLLYGHLDKQPEMTGWHEGFGPWDPVMREDKLYGRGGADDGYAIYASVTALLALQKQNAPRARCVVLIEACEESGSYDLPFYVEHLADRIGSPSLVICLDSGCGNYEQMWLTTSLRGLVGGLLTVTVLDEGVHSGDASGIVPDSFRIARALLSRIESAETGEVILPDVQAEIPEDRVAQAKVAAESLGEQVWRKFPFAGKTHPPGVEGAELVLNRTWRPQLAVVGAEGLPASASAGNVLRPKTSLKLSLRLPPTVDAEEATKAVKKALTSKPIQGAKVKFEAEQAGPGWNAPPLAPWLEKSIQAASRATFGKPAALMGEGGSIPFIGMLGKRFPKAQFLITGVLGPHSNAHGPNEFLHIPTGRNVTACAAMILADHGARGTAT